MERTRTFELGDVVVVDHKTLAKIVKVWKNGVVEIDILEGSDHRGRKFSPEGRERGNEYFRKYIRHLPEGETVESFLNEKKNEAEVKRKEKEQKQQEYKTAVATWWADEGKDIWETRIEMPRPFLGQKVVIIRFTRYEEERMPFVTIQNTKNWRERRKSGLLQVVWLVE